MAALCERVQSRTYAPRLPASGFRTSTRARAASDRLEKTIVSGHRPHDTVSVCDGALHVAVPAPPQFELGMCGLTAYPALESHVHEDAGPALISTPTHEEVLHVRPLHAAENVAPVRIAWHNELAVAPVQLTELPWPFPIVTVPYVLVATRDCRNAVHAIP